MRRAECRDGDRLVSARGEGGGQPRGFSNNRIIGCAFALDRVRPFESIGLVSNARRRMKSRLADFRGKIFLFHCILRYLNCYKEEGLRDLLEFI